MSFIWAPALLFLVLIPLGVWVYRARERRRAARVAQFGWGSAGGSGASGDSGAPVGSVASVARRRSAIRRIPAVCTVAGLSILVLSLARPESVIGVPRLEGTVLLAFDVSGSMSATDVAPTRMEAAKTAALAFVAAQPPSVRIGIVVFSDSGFSTQVPTYDRAGVETAIQRLEPERGTSLGGGILASLEAIAVADDPSTTDYYSNRSPEPTVAPTPVPDGVFEPTIIVLLSDGENTAGTEPLEAAQAARDRGIRIDTVGIGSPAGTTIEVEGFRIHSQLDEAVLRAISDRTGGTYYAAADQADLSAIYADVGSRLVVRTEPFELTPLLAVLGFGLLFAGGATSLRLFGRMP
jgi:Ca-activated chloride channel family protein